MAKGQRKVSREKKKPKQDKSDRAKGASAYQQSKTSAATPVPFGKKR
jgi:hypothetical protein